MSVHPSDRNWHQWSPEGSSNLSTCGYLGGIIGNLVLWPSHSHHADNGTLCELTFTLAAAAALLGIWRWISVGKKVKKFSVFVLQRGPVGPRGPPGPPGIGGVPGVDGIDVSLLFGSSFVLNFIPGLISSVNSETKQQLMFSDNNKALSVSLSKSWYSCIYAGLVDLFQKNCPTEKEKVDHLNLKCAIHCALKVCLFIWMLACYGLKKFKTVF